MKDLFIKFLESPNRESYFEIRNQLISSEHYKPYSDELIDVDKLLDAGKIDEAKELLTVSMPNLLLSPRAHLMISYISEQLDDQQGAKMEGFVAAACCEGILASGDGSKASPYFATRTSDEHDVVQYLGKQFKSQSLIHEGDRHFDQIECDDGTEIWFDISDAYNKLDDMLRGDSR